MIGETKCLVNTNIWLTINPKNFLTKLLYKFLRVEIILENEKDELKNLLAKKKHYSSELGGKNEQNN